jgi:hypothetical protein
MISYALRYGIDEIFRFYPNTIESEKIEQQEIIVKDMCSDGRSIRINVCQVPVLSRVLNKVL